MNQLSQQQRLIQDIAPAPGIPQPVDVLLDTAPPNDRAIKKPESKSVNHKHFYSQLASQPLTLGRIRRSRRTDAISKDPNQLSINFLSQTQTAAVRPLADNEEIPNLAVAIDEPNSPAIARYYAFEDHNTWHWHTALTAGNRRRTASLSPRLGNRFMMALNTVKQSVKRWFSPRRIIMLLAGLIIVGLASYQFVYLPIERNHQKQAAQSAAWTKAQAQWQCALQTWQSQQPTNVTKEKSCVNIH